MEPSRSVALPRLRAATGLSVTLALTAGLLATLPTVVAPVLDATGRPVRLDDLLALGCALVLVPAWCRLALGVALCLGETLVLSPRSSCGPRRPGARAASLLRPAPARRVAAFVVGPGVGGLVLAVGAPVSATAAATAAIAADAAAESTAALPVLAARSPLPLPRRPVGGLAAVTPRPQPVAGATVVVRPGDTLWALASRHLVAPGATDHQVDTAWQRLYAANRAVLGPDPDLIRPGSRLDLPAPASTEGHP